MNVDGEQAVGDAAVVVVGWSSKGVAVVVSLVEYVMSKVKKG